MNYQQQGVRITRRKRMTTDQRVLPWVYIILCIVCLVIAAFTADQTLLILSAIFGTNATIWSAK